MRESTPLLGNEHGSSTNDELPPLTSLFFGDGVGGAAGDHLANERTYLAWMRTSLAIIGVSMGLLKLDQFSNESGVWVAILGVAVLMVSTHRYYKVLRLLDQGKFQPNILGILIMVILIMLCVVGVFVNHYSGN